LRLLAFDTSGSAISAAAADGEALRAHRWEPMPRGHAERLLPLLGGVMGEAGWAWRDLELIAVTVGPGSFTGLRAGIAVARALALASGRAAIGVGTLELLAQGAAARRPESPLPIQVFADARRDEVYAQRFLASLEPFGPPEVMARPATKACLAPPCLVAVDSPSLSRDLPREDADVIEAAPDARYLVSAVGRRLSLGWQAGPGTALRPAYLRPPDARLSAGASMVTTGR
jgi:tRNA threonylcarbamoyladenosine biosynthesis protein TsaB